MKYAIPIVISALILSVGTAFYVVKTDENKNKDSIVEQAAPSAAVAEDNSFGVLSSKISGSNGEGLEAVVFSSKAHENIDVTYVGNCREVTLSDASVGLPQQILSFNTLDGHKVTKFTTYSGTRPGTTYEQGFLGNGVGDACFTYHEKGWGTRDKYFTCNDAKQLAEKVQNIADRLCPILQKEYDTKKAEYDQRVVQITNLDRY